MQLLTTDVVDQVCQLMKKDYHALGFLPRQAIENHWNWGELILQRDGKSIYGYLCHGPARGGRMVTVKQAYIDTDVRRVGFGRVAFLELVHKAMQGAALGIRLRCGEDLDSNLFWQAMGCRKTAVLTTTRRGWRHVESAGTWRGGRPLNVYEFLLQDTFTGTSDLGKLWVPDQTGLILPNTKHPTLRGQRG